MGEEAPVETEHLVAERLRKIVDLKAKGIEPYPYSFNATHLAKELHAKYSGLVAEQQTEDETTVAGRIIALRRMGKATFMHIQDASGRIQSYLKSDSLPEYDNLKLMDIGDFVGVSGKIFKTRTGELTIQAKSLTMLAKSIRPLPEKFHGLKDTETRYRQRYVDLIMNPEVKQAFEKRIEFTRQLRNFLEDRGFLAVETPTLESIPGGADAEPFVTHHNTLDTDFYLRISLELHAKRLLVGGFDRIYEIGKVFRNEGMSREHLQEFTLLEFYWAYHDYNDLMQLVQEMYQQSIQKTFGTLKTTFEGNEIDFSGSWPKHDYTELVKEKTGINLDDHPTKEALIQAIKDKALKLEVDGTMGRGRVIDQLYKAYVRPSLVQPCFLVDHPIDISPLVKKHRSKKGKVERFQVLLAGSEVGNGYSELNDPVDQRERFSEQERLYQQGDKEAQRIDYDFINALEIGMPPTAGYGVGIDRLFMIAAGLESVRDTIFFPLMKRE